MTTDLLTKAARVRAACVAALEVCEKRTPGEWEFSIESGVMMLSANDCSIPGIGDEYFYQHGDDVQNNMQFIALASRMTEPALRSTVIAIDALDYIGKGYGWQGMEARKQLTALLDCWPEEETAK